MVEDVIHPVPDQVVSVSDISTSCVSTTSLPALSSTVQCSAAGGLLLLLLHKSITDWPRSRWDGPEIVTEEGPTGIEKRARIKYK